MAKQSPEPQLGTFDGKEIIGTTIAITNAGDGLSASLSIDPQVFHHGDIVTVVLQCEVSKVSFVPIKDTDRLSRVHTMRAGIATIVDAALVADVLDKQRKKIEAAAGVQRIPFSDDATGTDD